MRKQIQLLNDFVPLHEKEWEAMLLIDEAIKSKAEYALESIARMLSGANEVSLSFAQEMLPFERTEHIETDKKEWVQKTTEHLIEAKMREFVFYGNSRTEIWLQIIDFWAGKQTMWPCGGANFNTNKPIKNGQ